MFGQSAMYFLDTQAMSIKSEVQNLLDFLDDIDRRTSIIITGPPFSVDIEALEPDLRDYIRAVARETEEIRKSVRAAATLTGG